MSKVLIPLTCPKCKAEMEMTPACCSCWTIPIATASFEQLEKELSQAKAELAGDRLRYVNLEYEAANQKLANVRDELKAQLLAWHGNCEKAQDMLAVESRDCKRLEAENERLANKCDELKANVTAFEVEELRTKRLMMDLKAENERLAKEVAEMQNDQGWQELNVKVIQLEAKLTTARKALAAIERKTDPDNLDNYRPISANPSANSTLHDIAMNALAAIDGAKEGK